MAGGQSASFQQGSPGISGTVALVGSVTTSGIGVLNVGSDTYQAATGQAATSGIGSTSSARLILLKSRKVGGGAASFALTGIGSTMALGVLVKDVSAPMVGVIANLSQGAFNKQRSFSLVGQSISSIQGSFVTADPYSSSEGSAIGPSTISIYWQSSFTTPDGKLIEFGTSDHGPHQDNGVREYDPVAKTQAYTFGPYNYGTYAGVVPSLNPGGPAFPMGAIPCNQYDNQHYFFIPRINSLVIPSIGQYNRTTGTWPLASRDEYLAEGVKNNTGTAQFVSGLGWDTRQLGWAGGNPVCGLGAGSLFRPVGTAATAPGFYGPPDSWYPGVYNPHQAWSEQLDAGFSIGGGNSDGDDHGVCWVIAPSGNFGAYSNPYALVMKTVPTIGGIKPNKRRGRDGACAVGPWIYWVGGQEANDSSSAHFWRVNLSAHTGANSESVSLSSGAGAIERLSDAPFATLFPLLRHDPFSNALLLICEGGIAMYDLRLSSWSVVTPSGYTSFFAGCSAYPNGCVGDFIDQRSSSLIRKFYWRAGGPDQIGMTTTQKQRFHSFRIDRPADPISYLNVQSFNPESPTVAWGDQGIGPLADCKHISITERSGSLYLFGGDWDDSYPYNSNVIGGYKPEGIISQNGRQEIWSCNIANAVSTGNAKWYLAGNAYAEYPYVSGAGNGYYSSATHGPYQPDGLGCFTDSSGQMWMGPCDVGYTDLDGYEIAGQKNTYAPLFKWTPPGANNTAVTGAGVNGVALGNGWTLPSQDRLAYCLGSGSSPVGTAGVDYDVAFTTSSCVGWGRPNKGPAYDPSDNKARVISVLGFNSSGTYYVKVSVYAFNCTPDGGGIHRWVKTDSPNIPVQNIGGPSQATITGINTSWGTGGIGNTCQIGRRLYASFVCTYSVTAGYGNRDSTTLVRVVILSINLDNLSDITWVPLPQGTNWWLRTFDGPEGAEAHALGYAPLTPGQYRSMVAVNNRLVIGPERWHKIGVDPLFSVYNPTTGLWKTSAPPSSSDFPNTIFSLTAVPSLNEVWLAGCPTDGDIGSSAQEAWSDSKGMYNWKAFHVNTGTYASRRILRYAVS